ncbi:hypothetical protein F3F94_19820, partial [Bacteroides salyersiae]
MKMNRISITTIVILAAALVTIHLLRVQIKHLKQERDRYSANTESLLSDIKRMKIDSCTTVVEVQTLKLTVDEYEKYRATDAAQIKKMGIRIKDLEAVGKHQITVDAPIRAKIRDSTIVYDAITVSVRKVEMDTPHLKLDGTIEDNLLKGKLYLPVNLQQAIWLEYKHKFLW